MNRGRALTQLSDCLGGQVPPDADWTAILALANDALIAAELHVSLVANDAVPAEVKAFLVEVYRRNHARNLSLFATLKDALAVLNPMGVTPVLLKGCAMWAEGAALTAPPQTGRMSSDIDLLTRPHEFEPAVNALNAAGFAILQDNRTAHHSAVVLGRSIDAGSIDFHRAAPGPKGIHAIDNLWDESQPIAIGEFEARTPPPELQILIGVLHDQLLDGHFWRGGFSLRHLIDIARLSKRTKRIDWDRLKSRCVGSLAASALSAQLSAAKHIAKADIPNDLCSGFWASVHYARQRCQFIWPAINAPFHALGLNKHAWQILSSRALRR